MEVTPLFIADNLFHSNLAYTLCIGIFNLIMMVHRLLHSHDVLI